MGARIFRLIRQHVLEFDHGGVVFTARQRCLRARQAIVGAGEEITAAREQHRGQDARQRGGFHSAKFHGRSPSSAKICTSMERALSQSGLHGAYQVSTSERGERKDRSVSQLYQSCACVAFAKPRSATRYVSTSTDCCPFCSMIR